MRRLLLILVAFERPSYSLIEYIVSDLRYVVQWSRNETIRLRRGCGGRAAATLSQYCPIASVCFGGEQEECFSPAFSLPSYSVPPQTAVGLLQEGKLLIKGRSQNVLPGSAVVQLFLVDLFGSGSS